MCGDNGYTTAASEGYYKNEYGTRSGACHGGMCGAPSVYDELSVLGLNGHIEQKMAEEPARTLIAPSLHRRYPVIAAALYHHCTTIFI